VALAPGQEGQVRIRSEFAVEGYFRIPEETAAAFRHGWFYPGDIGSLDADRMLFITGREKTMPQSRRRQGCAGSRRASVV